MRHRCLIIFTAVWAGFCLIPSVSMARIKLITLPVRQRVEIQLDNPNATLVEEERIVPLVRGVNQVDFSWANTQIDKNSIQFRPIAVDGQAENAVIKTERPLRVCDQQADVVNGGYFWFHFVATLFRMPDLSLQ